MEPARGRPKPGARAPLQALARRRHAGCFRSFRILHQSRQPARRVARAARGPRAAHWKAVRCTYDTVVNLGLLEAGDERTL